MAERQGSGLRPIGMRSRWLGLLLAGPLVLAGCGDAGTDGAGPGGPSMTASDRDCPARTVPAQILATLDLDGDGKAEEVSSVAGDGTCPTVLAATVAGHDLSLEVDSDLPLTSDGAAAVAIPGRTGAVLLVEPAHPRGGFQARIFGYAEGRFEELTVDGEPILAFIATDVLTTPTAAHCIPGGFEVVQARAHKPIGVVPAWDVFRTTYAVDGNHVAKGPTTEIADNVLDKQLHQKYSDLVEYRLFGNCVAPQ